MQDKIEALRTARAELARAKQTYTSTLEAEVKRIGGLAWVTAGREIENYLGSDVVDKALGVESPRAVGKYEKFTAYLDELKSGEGARFVRGKATYAARFTEALGKENLRVLDLEEQLGALVGKVTSWSHPKLPAAGDPGPFEGSPAKG